MPRARQRDDQRERRAGGSAGQQFVLNDAMMSPKSTGTSGSQRESRGTRPTTGSSPATPPASSQAGGSSSLTLSGHESDLAKHTGHRIEVTGALSSPSSPSTAPASGTATTAEYLQVSSIKMLSANCE